VPIIDRFLAKRQVLLQDIIDLQMIGEKSLDPETKIYISRRGTTHNPVEASIRQKIDDRNLHKSNR